MSRRLPLFALLLLAGCHAPAPTAAPIIHHPIFGAAIGGSGGASKPSVGLRTADIRDFGARAGIDCARAIQNAYDSLIPGGYTLGASNQVEGKLFIPSGTWQVNYPLIFDCSSITVECEAGAVISANLGGHASPCAIMGLKRVTDWNAGGTWPIGGAWTSAFPQDLRINLAGHLDGSVTGYGLRSRSPSSPAASTQPDHLVQLWDAPPASGANDHWQNTGKFTLEIAIENPLGAPTNAYICGMGTKDQAKFGPWSLTSNGSSFQFDFSAGGLRRVVYFGDATLTGLQRLCIAPDLTANDPDTGTCYVYASQNKNQVAVTRGTGTTSPVQVITVAVGLTGGTYKVTATNPLTGVSTTSTALTNTSTTGQIQTAMDSIFGASNTVVAPIGGPNWSLTTAAALIPYTIALPTIDNSLATGGVVNIPSNIPGFSAAMGMKFQPNYMDMFCFFADANHQGGAGNFTNLNIYGFQISKGWVYTDRASVGGGSHTLPFLESPSPTDATRYMNLGGANVIVSLDTRDGPSSATKTTDKLVAFYLSAGAGTSCALYGWYSHNTFVEAEGSNCTNLQTIQGGTWQSIVNGPGSALSVFNVINCGVFDGCDFQGSWRGVAIRGGYDYKMRHCTFSGAADAALMLNECRLSWEGLLRCDIGRTIGRFRGSYFDGSTAEFQGSNINISGTTSQAGFHLICNGGFGSDMYRFGTIGTDAESGGQCPMILAEAGGGYGHVSVDRMWISDLILGVPAIDLVTSSTLACELLVNHLQVYNGSIAARVDSPLWHVEINDFLGLLDTETVVLTNPIAGSDAHLTTRSGLPTGGRFLAGVHRLKTGLSGVGQATEYLCTASGTAAWDAATIYYDHIEDVGTHRGSFVSIGGLEYQVKSGSASNINQQPPNATYWTATGRSATAPVWAAVGTVGQ